jgi:ATP-dependent Clp protease ATP-binding subunit ClpA
MSTTAPLASDAALALGIAATALPFACTPEAEAECWLRILRLYGEASAVLQALGVGEDRVDVAQQENTTGWQAGLDRTEHRDMLEEVAEQASRTAADRGATGLATIDLLLAVIRVYGAHFDRALKAHGTSRDELSALIEERLGMELD